MGKINSNFQELYDTFGDGDDLESYVDSAGISTAAENLTGNPIINTTGAVVAGATAEPHLKSGTSPQQVSLPQHNSSVMVVNSKT